MRSSIKLVFLLCAAVILLAVPFFGSEGLNWAQVFEPRSVSHRIFFELRLPRLFVTLVAGGALATLGGTYQILFRNPLAEPYLLGISSAVSLGAAAGELLFHLPTMSYGSATAGFLAALLVTFLIVVLSASVVGSALERIVLFGVGLNFLLSAALFLLLSYFAQSMGGGSMRWLFGQVPWLNLKQASVFGFACAPFLAYLWLMGRKLDALSLGDAVARTLGVEARRVRPQILFLSSALVALVVCGTGSVGFVGLVIPHAIRLCLKPASSRSLLGFAFVAGAVFLSVSDVLSRILLPPFEFPIGVITTLVGGPLFLFLLWRRA